MAGGGGGSGWIKMFAGGGAVVAVATFVLPRVLPDLVWLRGVALGFGGLAVVFGSCEAMIKSVDGVGARLGWNPFVAGTMAGLASNVPELVMLGFVLAAEPRVGFVVTCLTLHVGALVFGIYSVFLPRDKTGHARLPDALVKVTTDLFAAAAGVFLGTGLIMLLLRVFSAGLHQGEGLGVADLAVLGVALLIVQVVATVELVKRFSGDDAPTPAAVAGAEPEPKQPPPSTGVIAGFGAIGLAGSVVGGHAVGDFADILVSGLAARGVPEMVGAMLLSVFASSGALAMIITSHSKKNYDIALASAAGQVSQVPFVVLPVAMLMLAVMATFGVIPKLASGAVLPIDLETTSVMLLAFPPMLMLNKAVQDDGHVSWVETAAMVCVFAVVLYLLAVHG